MAKLSDLSADAMQELLFIERMAEAFTSGAALHTYRQCAAILDSKDSRDDAETVESLSKLVEMETSALATLAYQYGATMLAIHNKMLERYAAR